MHKEILTKEQTALLPLVKQFAKDFFLVGGTAIALHLGHRRSIDFDLFSFQPFDNMQIRKKLIKQADIERVFVDRSGELSLMIRGVKITFLYYPFKIVAKNKFDGAIVLPSPLDLAAMKAYALGRRAKWKDYVDLYFVIKHHHGIKEIVKKAKSIFASEFNEKLFRSQLAYFYDIDRSEEVIFMNGFHVSDKEIEKQLQRYSLE